jgi:hypothetical protein
MQRLKRHTLQNGGTPEVRDQTRSDASGSALRTVSDCLDVYPRS